MPEKLKDFDHEWSVFSSIFVYNQKVQYLNEHCRRLSRDFSYLFNEKVSQKLLKDTINKIKLPKDNTQNRYKLKIRLINENHDASLYYSFHLVDDKKFKVIKGAMVHQLPTQEKSFFRSVKLPDYKLSKMILQRNKKNDEVLFCRGNKVLEFSIFNIFFISKNKIYTPKLNRDILPGIMRYKVLAYLRKRGLFVTEKNIKINELKKFDFCFATNSIRGLVPVHKIDKIKYNQTNKLFDQLKFDLWTKKYQHG